MKPATGPPSSIKTNSYNSPNNYPYQPCHRLPETITLTRNRLTYVNKLTVILPIPCNKDFSG
jgi:hypothetical protein